MNHLRWRLSTSINGDSDVGHFMMGTDLRCWWQNQYNGYFFSNVGDFCNISLNRSPTFHSCHQDILCYNIDVIRKNDNLSDNQSEFENNPKLEYYQQKDFQLLFWQNRHLFQ